MKKANVMQSCIIKYPNTDHLAKIAENLIELLKLHFALRVVIKEFNLGPLTILNKRYLSRLNR